MFIDFKEAPMCKSRTCLVDLPPSPSPPPRLPKASLVENMSSCPLMCACFYVVSSLPPSLPPSKQVICCVIYATLAPMTKKARLTSGSWQDAARPFMRPDRHPAALRARLVQQATSAWFVKTRPCSEPSIVGVRGSLVQRLRPSMA